jgi:hypothetical protein
LCKREESSLKRGAFFISERSAEFFFKIYGLGDEKSEEM